MIIVQKIIKKYAQHDEAQRLRRLKMNQNGMGGSLNEERFN